jgi:hypothetical protein
VTDIDLPQDLYTAKGAEKLKATILRYWLDRGYVNVRAETYQISSGIWGVRSNLVNGLPPKRLRKARIRLAAA